jgi:two-component system OmpR family response regulator
MATTSRLKPRVLVIDDDAQYLVLTARMLRSGGYEVLTRTEAVGTSAAVEAGRPDLILIDLNMPALDGDRLASLILRFSVDPPRVALYSGAPEQVLRERAAASGVDAIIPKGLPPDEFLERVARLLDAPVASQRER